MSRDQIPSSVDLDDAAPDMCMITHRVEPERPRHRAPGLLICRGCRERVRGELATLPKLHAALSTRLEPTRHAGGPKVSGSPAAALPIDATVADHREHVRALLALWCVAVVDEHPDRLHPPAQPVPAVTARWLLRHLDWCATQPWITDLAGELAQARARARGLLFPTGRRRIRAVCGCTEPGCAGTLTALVADDHELLPSEITCDTCGVSWPAWRWMTLGRRVHDRVAS